MTVVDGPVVLRFEGPGGGDWTIGPPGPEGLVVVDEGADPRPAATITSTIPEFVLWGTRRRPWRDRNLQMDGDGDYAARFLDAVNII